MVLTWQWLASPNQYHRLELTYSRIHRERVYLPRKSSGECFDYGYVNMNAPFNYLAAGQ